MAVKASAHITLSIVAEVSACYRFYLLQSSTLSTPSKPTANPPSGWGDTEPTYTAGSTNSLYTVDLTEFSDGTWSYSEVSLSSSYEAAKTAYNKAVAAGSTADAAKEVADAAAEVANGLVGSVEGIETSIITLDSRVDQTDADWSAAFSRTETLITSVDDKVDQVQTKVDEYSTWFTMNEDGLSIGKTEDGAELPLKVKLDNDSLDFLHNNIVVAYVSNEKLMINAAEIEGSLDVGGFRWTTRDNGNMGLMWIGG